MGNDNDEHHATRTDFRQADRRRRDGGDDRPAARARARLQAPSDLVNIATVGVSGMGAVNTRAVMSQNIVALCDVDFDSARHPARGVEPAAAAGAAASRRAAAAADAVAATSGRRRRRSPPTRAGRPSISDATLRRFVDEQIPRVKKYRDYREMLEKQKDIDAVIVATPDHMHAVIASDAMSLGKHVYVQKPLCWSVHEARHLAKKAKDNPKVVTQMGNQRHSADNSRRGDRVHPERRARRHPRGARLDESAAGLLAAGHAAAGTRSRPIPAQLRWDNRGVMQRLSAAMAGASGVAIRCPTSCRGICSSASRRTSSITRSITRSTGAAGSTGARARSATWART